MSYKPKKLRRWLMSMNAKQSLKGFVIDFEPNINKVTIVWNQHRIIFDPIFLPDEQKLTTLIAEL